MNEQRFLINGRKNIAKQFRVKPDKIKAWIAAGAPIWFNGSAWQTDFSMLVDWLAKNRQARKTCQVVP